MESITQALTHKHRECDEFFVGAENAVVKSNWDEAHLLFQQFRAAMEHHLQNEERVLFPAFEQRSGIRGGSHTPGRWPSASRVCCFGEIC